MFENKNYNPDVTEELEDETLEQGESFEKLVDPIESDDLTITEETPVETEATETVEETPVAEEPQKEAVVVGVVTGCSRLNVRKGPSTNTASIAVIEALDEVEVFENRSTDAFYRVRIASGVEGFCMKKFISIK